MKPFLERAVGIVQLIVFSFILASVGVFLGEKGLVHKHRLEAKKASLAKENERLTREIKTLERRITLLRADPATIERAAKRKLGMARPDETVYVFGVRNRGPRAAHFQTSLNKRGKTP